MPLRHTLFSGLPIVCALLAEGCDLCYALRRLRFSILGDCRMPD
jgi:hypothetical protein